MSRMKKAGPPKQKWTSEEESALREGVSKYGVGKWRLIQKDGIFAGVLRNRSNVDLKDKWRNLNMDSYTAAKEKARKRSKGVNKSSSKKPSRKARAGAAAKKAKRRALDEDLEMEDDQAFDDDDEEDDLEEQEEEEDDQQLTVAPVAHRRFPEMPLVADMIMAAIISLWHATGSSVDDVTEWIQDQYDDRSPSQEDIQETLAQMVEESQLTCTGESGTSYTLSHAMSEAVAKEESNAARLTVPNHSEPAFRRREQREQRGWPMQGLLQAAEAAAAAVREAEEAAAYAAELCAAAEELEANG
ncbi:hypothetical protein WJX84_004055 [Apatococcus fuscideae]|uniref:MYB transcription factor n=1 Tax=Apatococcus fuscideae TaxID=2026836 RepID=A0AAW1SLN9_9CHLO